MLYDYLLFTSVGLGVHGRYISSARPIWLAERHFGGLEPAL